MKLILNAKAYIERFLKIRNKKSRLVSFILNPPQQRLYEIFRQEWQAGKPVRIIILKARQMGFSTLMLGIIFFLAATSTMCECLIVAHKDNATKRLFQMARLFYDSLPPPLRPLQRASNAKELVFDKPNNAPPGTVGLGSRILCATAGGKGVGRGFTLRCLHLSEYAFWPGDKAETYTGLVQAVPDEPGTVIVIESTPNGFEDFKKKWDAAVEAQRNGTDGFIPVFFAWFEMPEYRRKPLPGFVRTAEEEELAEIFDLDDEQLAWRRWCIATQCGGDIDLFHQEYPSTPDEAFISTGRCAFNKPALVLRREAVRKIVWEKGSFRISLDPAGKIAAFRWQGEDDGPIRILEHPQPGVPYVVGGDTAGTGTDFFAAHVIDNRTGKQVAVLHHQFGERMFAQQIYCLGRYYNDALVGVEVNYSTYPEMVLEELGYPKLYVRQRYDNFLQKTVDAFGFDTNAATRQPIIDMLKDVAKQTLDAITDYDTLGEMLTFVYDEKWKAQAEQGEHDDLVMALAIAHAIRGQQTTLVDESATNSRTEWTDDMWEDYYNASPEQRTMLEQLWGQPRR